MEILTIPLSKIIPNEIQPIGRDEVDLLRHQIEESKFIAPCIVIPRGGKFVMADGHRRRRVVQEMGGDRIDAVAMPAGTDPMIAFARCNAATRPFKGGDWFNMWALAEAPAKRTAILAIMPRVVAGNIRRMVEIFGAARATEIGLTPMGETGEGASRVVSPGVAHFIERLRTIVSVASRGDLTDRQLGDWLLKHKQTNTVNKASREMPIRRAIAEKFARAIENDVPFQSGRGRQRGAGVRRRAAGRKAARS